MNSEFSRLNHELHRFNLPTRPDNRTAAYLQASHRSATQRPTMTTGSNPLASHMMTKTHGAAAAAAAVGYGIQKSFSKLNPDATLPCCIGTFSAVDGVCASASCNMIYFLFTFHSSLNCAHMLTYIILPRFQFSVLMLR